MQVNPNTYLPPMAAGVVVLVLQLNVTLDEFPHVGLGVAKTSLENAVADVRLS